MEKTTVYLEPEVKRAIKARARESGLSEAEVIRASIRASVLPAGVSPRAGLFTAEAFADRVDELLVGFGEK